MKKVYSRVLSACIHITSVCSLTATLSILTAQEKQNSRTAEKFSLQSFSAGVVGTEVITDQDVEDRLAMEEKFFRRMITAENHAKRYTQVAQELANESRQRQAPARLVSMAKNSHQTQAIKMLLPSEIKKEVDERINTMAQSNNMTVKQFQTLWGSYYQSFYRKQEANVSYQRFLMFKYGARAMRNIAANAIAKERKKWKSLQGATQYRVSEIVIYNRNGKELAYNKMREIDILLKEGESFSELACRLSQARTSDRNGDCDWKVLDYFDRPIQNFLRTADIGDISPIIALPTERNPEKWVIVLLTDQRIPGKDGVASEKDPGDDFFRNRLFSVELERLSKSEMDDLEKSFPCTLHIKEKRMR